MVDRPKRDRDAFDGTILGLSRRYQTDEASPFKRLKHNTRHKDTYTLALIEKAFGTRSLAALKIGDFYRWYEAAKKPKSTGGPERVRRAYGIIKELRELFAFGIMAELPECRRLYEVLEHARFAQPARRRIAMELSHVEAFVAKAIELDGCRWRWALRSSSRPRFARRTSSACGSRSRKGRGPQASC